MKIRVICCALVVLLGGCAAGGSVNMGTPQSKSVVTGAAGGKSTHNVSSQLERCESPIGTLAVNEDRTAGWYGFLSRYGIQSTVPILRLLAQQSNCFVVVERGAGFHHMTRERQLQQSGELRQNSNFGKGQMVAADYTANHTLLFNARDTGGLRALGSVAGGAFGSMGSVLGATLGGSVKSGQAQSMLTLVDNRSGIQVGVAEGSASSTNFGGLLGILGTNAAGALSGYTKTPEGKLVIAAMTDSFNNMVRVLRNYQPQDATGPNGMGTGGKLKVN